MSIDATKIQNMVFHLADGLAVIYPVSLPFVKIAEAAILALEGSGITPTIVSAEQLTAIQAGMASARASAVVSYKAHEGNPAKDSFANIANLGNTPQEMLARRLILPAAAFAANTSSPEKKPTE